MDEFEALRLADLDGAYHEQAALEMNVSRQTFGRILESARRKVARVLVEGLALRIEGGVIERTFQRAFTCAGCGKDWEEPFGTGRPAGCPACGSADFFRSGCGKA
jgi:DNA-directed RNA polymerase subunit RPC12/RpoP